MLATALDYARQIVQNSPDAVQSSKRALLLTKQKADVEDIVACHVRSPEGRRGFLGENIKVSGQYLVWSTRRSSQAYTPSRKDWMLSGRSVVSTV